MCGSKTVNLNKVVQRGRYVIPTIEDIMEKDSRLRHVHFSGRSGWL